MHWGCRVGLAAFIFADSNMATSWWEPVWAPFCKSGSPVASLVCDPTTHLLSETTLLCFFLLDALIAVAVFHAVRRHRVVNVSFAVSRGTTLVLTWIIIAAGFTALTILVEEMGVLPSREDKFVWYFAALLVIKITFEWLHEKLNDLCDHLFFHRLHRAEHRFGEVRERLAEARDLDEVDGRMIREPYACLDLASAAAFRRDAGDVFRPHIPPAGWDSTRPGAALPAGEVEHLLDGARGPVRLDARARILALPGGTAQPVIAAPVLGNVGLAAVALYGAHRTGDDLSNEEFALLRDLAGGRELRLSPHRGPRAARRGGRAAQGDRRPSLRDGSRRPGGRGRRHHAARVESRSHAFTRSSVRTEPRLVRAHPAERPGVLRAAVAPAAAAVPVDRLLRQPRARQRDRRPRCRASCSSTATSPTSSCTPT